MNQQNEQAPGKRERQKETRRKQILEAAFSVFTSQGFNSTRLDEVATAAGVGKGTIYLYFDSKEALFEEVVRENMFPARDEAASRVAEFQGSAGELLKNHLLYMYSRIMADEKLPPLVAMVIGEGARFPALTDFFFKEMINSTQEIMRRIISRGVESGEFRDTDVSHYTQIIVAPILISAIWKLQFEKNSPLDLDAFATTHLDILLNGLSKR